MWKICTKCKKHKALWEFNRGSWTFSTKSQCRQCDALERQKNPKQYGEKERIYNKNYREKHVEKLKTKEKKYRENNRDLIREGARKFRIANREKIRESQRVYRENNRDLIREKAKKYRHRYVDTIKKWRLTNKEKIRVTQKKYRHEHQEEIKNQETKYNYENRHKIRARAKKYSRDNKDKIEKYIKENYESIRQVKKNWEKAIAKYNTYKDKLTIEESPRLADDKISLEIKCRYCGKYHITTNKKISTRVYALNTLGEGEYAMYCSDICKYTCPIFNRETLIGGNSLIEEAPAYVRHLVFKLDDYTCQKCLNTEGPHECHHIKPKSCDPMLSADPDNCITLCKECHKKVHKQPGCTYHELAKSSINN